MSEQMDEVIGAEVGGDDEAPLDVPVSQRRVKTDKKDWPIETIVSNIERKKILLQPDFQREFVWDRKKSSRLIESLFLEIPVPVVYVAEMPDGKLEVVDGQQRLTTIHAYKIGKFPDGTDFKLSGLQVLDQLNGMGYGDLPDDRQEALLSANIRVIVIERDSHPDVKFEVFERLNSGAERLNDQELRNSIYRGPYNNLLRELAGNEYMLKVMRQKKPHRRMADRQLILRFFAMWHATHLKYKSPVKQFLNREMEANRQMSPAKVAELKALFEKSIELAWLVFGENAFRRWKPADANEVGEWESTRLNASLWDTLLYTFGFYEKRQIVPIADAVREEFIDMSVNDPYFDQYVLTTGDKPDRVRYRADVWRKRLDELVRVPAGEARGFSRDLKQKLHAASPACAICDQHIHDADDAEVDHVEHYWRGGRTIPSNARLVHRFCNHARGGRD